MARVKSLESVLTDIENKKKEVATKKEAYEKAVKEYKELCDKKDAIILKELNEAISGSTKNLDDVFEFLRANKKEENKTEENKTEE